MINGKIEAAAGCAQGTAQSYRNGGELVIVNRSVLIQMLAERLVDRGNSFEAALEAAQGWIDHHCVAKFSPR